MYACPKGMRISKCNKVKAKDIILIIHVPHHFKQHKSLHTLNSIFPSWPISLQIPPESRGRAFLTYLGNDSTPTLGGKDSSHRYLFIILYLIVRYPWMTAEARSLCGPPWLSSISPVVQGQDEMLMSLSESHFLHASSFTCLGLMYFWLTSS